MPVMVPAGMMSEPPGSKGDEPSPAGTALAPAGRCHPAGVPYTEREAAASTRRAGKVNRCRSYGDDGLASARFFVTARICAAVPSRRNSVESKNH
jgi:hypothetical protein